jgi:type II secretory pathway pseudopilin PulG
MRTNFSIPPRRRRPAAFTLVEVLITMVTTTIIMGGVMAAYMYGLRMVQFVQPKLTSSDEARKAVSLLTEEIRAAFDVKVGNRDGKTFAPVAPFTAQQGNALRIYPGPDSNVFVFYFWDVNDKTLKRTTNNATTATIVAESVSNSAVFAAEDFKGTLLSNDVNNRVIVATLQFYQIHHPKVAVGPGNYYDWYQLQCKVTKRTLD